MSEEKSEKLGLRGRLALLDSALRLLGGANATGAIAAGAAFHAFEKSAEIQSAVRTAAVLFLFGIFAFVIAYAGLFFAAHDIDHSMHKEGEETWPAYLFWDARKNAEEYKTAARRELIVTVFGGLASFVCFFIGLGLILLMAVNFQLG
jgi:hypothetical protein